MEKVILQLVFSLSAGFMIAFGGALVWDYYKGKRLDWRYKTICLVSWLTVIITNQLF